MRLWNLLPRLLHGNKTLNPNDLFLFPLFSRVAFVLHTYIFCFMNRTRNPFCLCFHLVRFWQWENFFLSEGVNVKAQTIRSRDQYFALDNHREYFLVFCTANIWVHIMCQALFLGLVLRRLVSLVSVLNAGHSYSNGGYTCALEEGSPDFLPTLPQLFGPLLYPHSLLYLLFLKSQVSPGLWGGRKN